MAVENTSDYSGPFAPDGVATAFPFDFVALSADEVTVLRLSATSVQTILAGFTVVLEADGTGTVTFSIAPAAGDPLYIVSNPSFEQQVTFANQQSFSAVALGKALDRAAVRDIALSAALSRTLMAPPTETLGVLPPAATRGGGYLAFDADGLAYVASGTGNDSALRTDLAANAGSALVGVKLPGTGTVARTASDKLSDIGHWKDFGIVADGVANDTTAVQAALNWCGPGKLLIMPGAKVKISSTITYGNGSSSALSTIGNNCTIIWGGEPSNANALIDTSDPWYSTAQSGTQFVWAGSAGGTMFQLNGPIQGLRWIGALTLNGGCVSNGSAGSGNCFQAYSFSSCTFDSIVAVNWQASGRGILLSTVNATAVGGNANPVVSGENRIARIFAHSPYGHNGECVRFDGYRVASGPDFTVGEVGAILCGISGTGAKGVCLGYIDDLTIGKIVNTTYGAISSSPYGIYLDSTTTPFPAPARVYIGHASVGQGLTVGGGTTAQVDIMNYEMDDGAVLPTGVSGLSFRVRKTGSALDGMYFPATGKTAAKAVADGDGFYGQDANGVHQHSITRHGTAAHVAGYGNIEWEAGATGGPTTAAHMTLSTARLTMGVPINRKSYTFATLPASPSEGDGATITDCNSTTYMAAAAGGGANHVNVTYLGGSWKIA